MTTKLKFFMKYINDLLLDLRNEVNRKEILKKISSIVEKILNFNQQRKGRGLKILTSKQMLKRLSIAFAQVKAGNASENLLNEIVKSYIFCIKQMKLLQKYITI